MILHFAFSADWTGFIDNNAGKEPIDNLKVISFDEFKEHHENSCVVIGSYTYGKEMYEDVLSLGISDVFDVLAFHKPLEANQYFDVPEFFPNDADVLVDCGAFDGFNTLNFARLSNNKYKHIYCLEPNKNILPTLKKNLESIERFTLIEKGTWGKAVSKSFAYNNTGSKVVENFVGAKIELDSLYNLLGENEITFIKMDIEGSEGKTIIGAEKIIRKQKPKMTVCVYHRKEDIIELPALLLEYNPDYNFYFRHYSLNECETVLYAF